MDVVPTPAVSMEDVAGRIRKARVARDWTQIELAEHAGVSRPTVARVERGDDISTATLAKVAGALGLRVELRGNR
jgi:transcriptional regulator with XRE-family HTH domain